MISETLVKISSDVQHLSLILAIAAILHITEEFIFPGRFIEWYEEFMPPKSTGRGPSFLVWINAFMIFILLLTMSYGNTSMGASLWIGVAIFLLINAMFHIYGVVKLHKYSPGVITGVLLYIPIVIIGSTQLYQQQFISLNYIMTFFGIALVYHLLSARAQGK